MDLMVWARAGAGLAGALGLASLLGCVGTPTPLAPWVEGSLGLPHHGVLTGGAKLRSEGPGFERFRSDDIRWANPRLVGSIERAAAQVARERPGGEPLIVADLSAEHGGPIVRHRSHRNGRDGDLLFYVSTPDGRPKKSPGFVRFGADGLAETPEHGFVRFDVDRNWRLVRALVTDPEASIQYIFVARWIEALLVEHALAAGEPLETVWRAQVVLRQPGDSAAHDDHFHVRIACTPDEAARGCAEGGPQRPWLPTAAAPTLSDDHVLAALFDGGQEPLASP